MGKKKTEKYSIERYLVSFATEYLLEIWSIKYK